MTACHRKINSARHFVEANRADPAAKNAIIGAQRQNQIARFSLFEGAR